MRLKFCGQKIYYPVEKVMGISIETLYRKFSDWTADLSDVERLALFHYTAVNAYKLGS